MAFIVGLVAFIVIIVMLAVIAVYWEIIRDICGLILIVGVAGFVIYEFFFDLLPGLGGFVLDYI